MLRNGLTDNVDFFLRKDSLVQWKCGWFCLMKKQPILLDMRVSSSRKAIHIVEGWMEVIGPLHDPYLVSFTRNPSPCMGRGFFSGSYSCLRIVDEIDAFWGSKSSGICLCDDGRLITIDVLLKGPLEVEVWTLTLSLNWKRIDIRYQHRRRVCCSQMWSLLRWHRYNEGAWI